MEQIIKQSWPFVAAGVIVISLVALFLVYAVSQGAPGSPNYTGDPYYTQGDKVYFGIESYGFVVEEADPKTFRFLGGITGDMSNNECKYDGYDGVYAKDQYNVFYNFKIIPGADVQSFEYVKTYYAKDKYAAYYSGDRYEGADVNSLKIVDGTDCNYLKDNKAVYYHGQHAL